MTGRSLLCGIGPNGKATPVSVNATGQLAVSGDAGNNGGGSTPSVVTPMQRQNVTGPQVNYYTAIAAVPGQAIIIHSVSLLLDIPVQVTFLSEDNANNLGPVWATFDNAEVIEPPFKQAYALPVGSSFVIRLNNGEDDVGISGTIEYKTEAV